MKRLLALLAPALLAACAMIPQHQASLTADSGGAAPHHPIRFAATFGWDPPVYCIAATATPCNATTNPGNGSQGDPAWLAFGKLNASLGQLQGLFTGDLFGGLAPTATGTYCLDWGSLTQQPTLAGCSGSSGGGGATFQVNGASLSSSSVVNWENSAPVDGLTLTVSNPLAGNVQLGLTGLPALVASDCLASNAAASAFVFTSCGSGGGGSGMVTSVGLSLPSWLSVSGSPITTSGTLAVAAAAGLTAHEVLGTGTSGTLGLESLTAADLPASITSSTSGNAATATALAATPTPCAAGEAANGVAANGNAIGCFTPTGSGTINSGTAGQIAYYAAAGTAVSGESTTDLPQLTADTTPASGDLLLLYSQSAAADRNITLATLLSGMSIPTFTGTPTSGNCAEWSASGILKDAGSACGGAGGSDAFATLTSGTNTTAAMLVGTGSSLSATGSGTISANQVNDAPVPASEACLGSNSSSQLVAASCSGTAAASGSTYATQYNAGAGAFAGVGPGISGQVLTSQGSAAAPAFASLRQALMFSCSSVASGISAYCAGPLGTELSSPSQTPLFPYSGSIKNLYIYASTPPSTGQTYTFTIGSGAPGTGASLTTLTCQVAAGSHSCSDTTDNPTVTAGNGWYLSTVTTTGGTTGAISVGFEFDSP